MQDNDKIGAKEGKDRGEDRDKMGQRGINKGRVRDMM